MIALAATQLPPPDAIPAALLALPNWLAWKLQEREGKPTKVPFSPITRHFASSTDAATWGTFDQAAAFALRTKANGVGFVFTNTPLCGIDLDHCIDPASGEIDAWALEIVRHFDSYTEVSPSGTGLHIFVQGTLPGGGRKRKVAGSHPDAAIEVYDHGRYFTVTGRMLSSASEAVEARQVELDEWHAATFKAPEPEAGPAVVPVPAVPVNVADAELIELAKNARNGSRFAALWAGDTSGNGGDDSAADLALCNDLAFWTGKDPVRMDALFRQSGLMRPKWDGRRGKETYGQWTIRKAIAGTGDTYAGKSPEVDTSQPKPTKKEAAAGNAEMIDAESLMRKDFPIPRYAVPELLPEGLSILGGKPKQGKSWLGLGIALSVASGTPALGQIEVTAGDVLYMALEDGQRRLQRRLNELLGDIPPPKRLTFATKWPSMDEGGLEALRLWLTNHPSTRLVVIDTFVRFRPEEKRGAGMYTQDYKAIAPLSDLAHDFNISIVIVMHNRKMVSDDPMDLISGTLGLSGAADGVLIMQRERGSADAMLHVIDRDQEDKTVALRWNIANGGWLWLGDAQQYKRSMARNEVLAALHDFGGGTPKELSERMNRNKGAINRLLWELRQSGEATNAGGVYMPLVPRPTDVPSFLPIAIGEEGEEAKSPKRRIS